MSSAPPLSAILRHAKPAFNTALTKTSVTKQSALQNGFRIASEQRNSETCTVGVWIDAGSRWETKENNGVAHYLEHLNFKGTAKRSRRDIEYGMERLGAHLNAYTSREHTSYYIKCFKKDVPTAVELLSDVLLHSNRTEADVESERSVILTEKQDVEARVEEVLMDHLHRAAYETDGLGLPILGSEDNIKTISKKMVDDFVKKHYTGPRMVLVGSGGVDHDQLCDLAAKHFGEVPSANLKPNHFVRYLSGDLREVNEYLPVVHMALAYQTPGVTHSDGLKFRLLEQLLGNYSRDKGEAAYSCFTRDIVLEFSSPHVGTFLHLTKADHNPVHSIQTFWTSYADTGLFGFYAIVEKGTKDDGNLKTVLMYAARQLWRITQAVTNDEFERAKNQLKVQALLQLDGTTNIADDIGRQVLWFGSRTPLATLFEQIDAIKVDDFVSFAKEYLYDKDPVLTAIGDLQTLPRYDTVKRLQYSLQI